MHYYQRDLRPALSDLVPTNPLDQASHQHMVTYTITFSGFNGSLHRNPFPSQDGRTFWPDPYAPEARPQFSIDDLRHAAFNGRGQFFQTSDAASLLTALRSAVAGIAAHTSSAGPVTLNTGARTTSSRLYQATGEPRSFPWRIAWLNMIGSILFMISALASFVLPRTGELINSRISIAGTLLGALCFLIGAILMFPAWRHAVRVAQPSRPEDPQNRRRSQ